jgi:hypothetical protein
MTAEAALTVTRVEVVRASATTSLVRVDLDGAAELTGGALLVVRGVGLPRRIAPLPTRHDRSGGVRLAFAIPSALRDGRFALQLEDREVALQAPPERSREDAMARIHLERAQRRLAELEAQIAAGQADRPAAASASAPDAEVAQTGEQRARLEEQLAQHRLLRAQLSRELETVRSRTDQVETELERARQERERLEEELAMEQSQRADEQARLGETIEAARSRVSYLELRLVELQGRSQDPGDK